MHIEIYYGQKIPSPARSSYGVDRHKGTDRVRRASFSDRGTGAGALQALGVLRVFHCRRPAQKHQRQGPAFEFNVGALPNLQAHLVLPLAFTAPQDGPSAYGLGDMEFGLKYRFLQETEQRPMVGVFPLLEIPTGDANRGLGNGQAWGKLPLWLQKNWGPWMTYWGGGYAINPAPEQHS